MPKRTPMAKNWTKIVFQNCEKKVYVYMYFFYHFLHSGYSYLKAITFKTRFILGTLDQDQITFTGLDFKTTWEEEFFLNKDIEKYSISKAEIVGILPTSLTLYENETLRVISLKVFLRKYIFWVSRVKRRKWQKRLMIKQTHV